MRNKFFVATFGLLFVLLVFRCSNASAQAKGDISQETQETTRYDKWKKEKLGQPNPKRSYYYLRLTAQRQNEKNLSVQFGVAGEASKLVFVVQPVNMDISLGDTGPITNIGVSAHVKLADYEKGTLVTPTILTEADERANAVAITIEFVGKVSLKQTCYLPLSTVPHGVFATSIDQPDQDVAANSSSGMVKQLVKSSKASCRWWRVECSVNNEQLCCSYKCGPYSGGSITCPACTITPCSPCTGPKPEC